MLPVIMANHMDMKWKIVWKRRGPIALNRVRLWSPFALAFCKTNVTLLGSTTKKNATQHKDLHKEKS